MFKNKLYVKNYNYIKKLWFLTKCKLKLLDTLSSGKILNNE